MSTKGTRRRQKSKSIEDIYRNNNFVPPKEQNLETIFEEPRRSKDGVPILTSVKKYKRYLHFDPTQNKIQKRKRKAKKCLKNLKTNYRITRSSPQSSKSGDISRYILDAMDDSSSDSDMKTSPSEFKSRTFSETSPCEFKSRTFSETYINTERRLTARTGTRDSDQELSCSDIFGTPKRPRAESRLFDQYGDSSETPSAGYVNNDEETPQISATSVTDAPESDIKSNTPDETVQSPRRSCIIS